MITANGTILSSILYCNSREVYMRINYMYSVISVTLDSLPANTQMQRIDQFVAFEFSLFSDIRR